MGQPHPGITRVVIMLTVAVCSLFLLLTFAVLWGALRSTRNLGDAETGLLLVLGTGIIGLVGSGLGAYFGIEDDVNSRGQAEEELDEAVEDEEYVAEDTNGGDEDPPDRPDLYRS